jgi:hypothetical protein
MNGFVAWCTFRVWTVLCGQCCVDSVDSRSSPTHRRASIRQLWTQPHPFAPHSTDWDRAPLWSTLVHSGPLYSALVRVDIGLGLLSVARGTRQSQAYSSIPILRREVLVLFRLAWHEFLQTCKLVFWPWLDSEGSDLGDLTSAMPCTARPADIDSEGPSSAELSRSSSRRGLASGWLVS